MATIIYGLDDPSTQELRYIGKTRQSLRRRLQGHLRAKEICHRTSWINYLKTRDLKPGIFEIESVSEDDADNAEKFWISYFKFIGANLTNNTEGGGGMTNPSAETR